MIGHVSKAGICALSPAVLNQLNARKTCYSMSSEEKILDKNRMEIPPRYKLLHDVQHHGKYFL